MRKIPGPGGIGNGVPQGGVLLGGRRIQVTIDRVREAKLSKLAEVNNAGVHEAAEILLSRAIDQGFAQLQASKFIAMCTVWLLWSHATLDMPSV